MLPCIDDPGESVCSECSRSTFRPPQGVADERDNEAHVHGHRGLTGRSTKARDLGLPTGSVNAVIRRFA